MKTTTVHSIGAAAALTVFLLAITSSSTNAFTSRSHRSSTTTTTHLFGWFDNAFQTGGSGNSKERLDEQWEAQQKILKNRRAPASERKAYFQSIEERRNAAAQEREQKWGWQTKNYKKGEDPLTEWKQRRKEGSISDLDDQYGDPKKIGGIPLPMASFGVGGEFGVGGKYDNGGRFDLRLPYADQGYVDEDADFMGKLFGKKKNKQQPEAKKNKPEEPKKKKGGWPW